MSEKIAFWRWVTKPRQLLAGGIGAGGAVGVVEVAEYTSSIEPSFHWFAAGAIAGSWLFFCLFEGVRNPEEYT